MAAENTLKDLVTPIIAGCSLVLSFISILVSAFTLYLTQLKKANISITPGDDINVGYFKEGNFQLLMSLLISNSGAEIAVINRFLVVIQEVESDEGYLLEPYSFQKVNDIGFQAESLFSPFALLGKQNQTKLILFRSSLEDLNNFRKLKAADYKITLLVWIDNSSKVSLTTSFIVNISPEIAEQLNYDLKYKTGNTMKITQKDLDMFKPKPVNKNQIKTLFHK